MSKHDRAAARAAAEYRDKFERSDRTHKESSRKDRGREPERPHKSSRRHRSPSYDSGSESEDSYDTVHSREPSPRRPSRRHTTAAPAYVSDPEPPAYRGRDKERRRRDSYSDYSRSPSPERSRKGIVEDLLAAVGLIQGKHKDRGHSTRDGRYHEDGDRSKNVGQALQAALTAAAMEAWRTRKEGKFTPQRIMQIAGAAIAAGGLDALVEFRGGNSGSMRHLVESVVGGLATSKTMGKLKSKRSESVEERGESKSGLVGMAARQLLSRSLSKGAGSAPQRRRTDRF